MSQVSTLTQAPHIIIHLFEGRGRGVEGREGGGLGEGVERKEVLETRAILEVSIKKCMIQADLFKPEFMNKIKRQGNGNHADGTSPIGKE